MAVSMAGFLAVDWKYAAEKRARHNDVAGFIYAVVGPLYAILLAFVVFVVWGHFEDAKTGAATEANEAAGIWRQAAAMDSVNGPKLRELTITYVEDVVRDDWPLLGKYELSPKADQDAANLYNAILALPVDNAKEQALYSELVSEVHNLLNERRIRLLRTQETLHPVLWVVLLGGGVVTIAYAYIFGIESKRTHLLLIAVLAGTVASMLCMIKLIDGPFQGTVTVQPEAFEAILRTMTAGG
jgi:Protein of unknown function (DUF4239)